MTTENTISPIRLISAGYNSRRFGEARTSLADALKMMGFTVGSEANPTETNIINNERVWTHFGNKFVTISDSSYNAGVRVRIMYEKLYNVDEARVLKEKIQRILDLKNEERRIESERENDRKDIAAIAEEVENRLNKFLLDRNLFSDLLYCIHAKENGSNFFNIEFYQKDNASATSGGGYRFFASNLAVGLLVNRSSMDIASAAFGDAVKFHCDAVKPEDIDARLLSFQRKGAECSRTIKRIQEFLSKECSDLKPENINTKTNEQ